MDNIILLDCTLRDGGYINKWHFGRQTITGIFTKLAEAKLDIVEVGFLTAKAHTADESLYSDAAEIDAAIASTTVSLPKVTAMIAIGEMEMDPSILPFANETKLDMVRITFHQGKEEKKAFRYAKCLQEKGYQVCMQPVGTPSYTDAKLCQLISEINSLSPYAFYLVDTLGVLELQELMRLVRLIDENLLPDILLGFHSHNNLQMSYADAQCIAGYDSKRQFILDCSVYGMGRGAGNLCTELIADYQNRTKGNEQYNMLPLYEVLDEYIYPIYLHTGWGYNPHYYISAVHQCHPNYAAFLMNKQTLTMKEVNILLKNIPFENRYVFNKDLIESLYYDFQKHDIDDENFITVLKNSIGDRDVLVLASGKSLSTYHDSILTFIQSNNPVVVSINSLLHGIPSDYLFVSNLKRFYAMDTASVGASLIFTSNIPHIVRKAGYVDYASLCDKQNGEIDNSGVMLLRLMRRIGKKKVYIAGYDGFVRDMAENYYNNSFISGVDSSEMDQKNQSITRQITKLLEDIDLISLTPSKYLQAKGGTKYKLIIFDLDGTLADTSDGIYKCHILTNDAMGRPVANQSLLGGVIGEPLFELYRKRFGYSEEESHKAVTYYRERYAQVGMENVIPYPGMLDCLVQLKQIGYKLAVATLKEEKLAKNILRKMGYEQYFDAIVGMDSKDTRTKKDMLTQCMKIIGVVPSETVLVGDTERDAKSAQEIGVSCIGVTYGFGFQKGLCASETDCLSLIDDPIQLADWFVSQ